MNQQKSRIRGAIAAVTVLIVFVVLSLVIPFPRGGLFWVGFGFGLLALVLQLPIVLLAFGGKTTPKSRFYGVPILRVGVCYGILQLIVSFAAMALGFVPGFPVWIPLVLCVLLLAAAVLGILSTDHTRDQVEQQEEMLKRDLNKMRNLQALGKDLAGRCENKEALPALKKLADRLRYSDPVSSEATREAEDRLALALDSLAQSLNCDTETVNRLCKEAAQILDERNRICKLNKGV